MMPYADPLAKKRRDAEYRESPECKCVDNALARRRYATDPSIRAKKRARLADPKKRQHRRAWESRWKDEHTAASMVHQLKRRAKKLGVPFDLVPADVQLPAVCPVLGIPVGRGMGREHAYSADRIVPERGYVKGNVLVVSNRANRWKSDMTLADMKRLVEFYTPLIKNQE